MMRIIHKSHMGRRFNWRASSYRAWSILWIYWILFKFCKPPLSLARVGFVPDYVWSRKFLITKGQWDPAVGFVIADSVLYKGDAVGPRVNLYTIWFECVNKLNFETRSSQQTGRAVAIAQD